MESEDSESSRNSSIWSQMPTPELSTAAAVPVARTDAAKQVQIQRVRDSITEMSNILSELRAMREQQWSPLAQSDMPESPAVTADETVYLDAYEQPPQSEDAGSSKHNRRASYSARSTSGHPERKHRQTLSASTGTSLDKPFRPRPSTEFERRFAHNVSSLPESSKSTSQPPLPVSAPPPFSSRITPRVQAQSTSMDRPEAEDISKNAKEKILASGSNAARSSDAGQTAGGERQIASVQEQPLADNNQKPKQRHRHRHKHKSREHQGQNLYQADAHNQGQDPAQKPDANVRTKTADKTRRSFAKTSIESLLAHSPAYELEEIDLPAPERRLMEKFIDSLSKLSIEVQMDEAKRKEGRRRLNNALRALEGWI